MAHRLILVSGPPCSGKSTLAEALAVRLGAPVLDVDEIRKAVLPHSRQSEEDRDLAYRCVHIIAEKLLEAGVESVILAATYGRQEPRTWLRELTEREAATLYVIQCRADVEGTVVRFRQRAPGHAAVDLDEDSVRQQALKYPYGTGALIDTTQVLDECVAEAARYVQEDLSVDATKWESQTTVDAA